MNYRIFLILCLLILAGCTTDGWSTPAPTFTAAPEVIREPATGTPAPPAVLPQDATLPADATPLPSLTPELTPIVPYTTATLQKLSGTCLRATDYEPIVNRYLVRAGKPDLKALWEEVDADNPVYDLQSSFTDITNTYSHATTYSRMLLVGEYPIAINRPGAVGYAHCAVLIYKGGDDPEVGVGITDATINDTWSGFAYGEVRSEADMRRWIQERTGKVLIVRYHVSQDPRDANFVRTGFFSPVMKLLWQDSYYTRFRFNPDQLKENVGNPRGPGLRELMVLDTSWPDTDIGIFLDYMIDPIL